MKLAAVALPAVAFCVIWWLITNCREVLGLARLSWRGTGVVAFLVFQALLVLITECLSIDRHLTPTTTVLGWLVVDVVAAVVLVGCKSTEALTAQLRSLSSVGRWLHRQPIEVVIGMGLLVGIFVALGVTAWWYLPSNGDSLVYHLARVAHWEQESSIAHFATHYTAQIELAPLHEFNMLHLHLITGSDRLDGFVQLGALAVGVLGAAEIARLLGARSSVQVAAGVIFTVLPSAVLEAASTQNNLFAAACGTALVVVLLAWIPLRRWVAIAALFGLGVGLAVLAKGTLPPLIGPVMLLVAVRLVVVERRSSSWSVVGRRLAMSSVVVVACAVVVAGPFLERNHDLFGTFAGPVSDTTINSEFSARQSLGNVVRSVAVNFRVGGGRAGPDTAAQNVALGGLKALYEFVGASPEDQRYVLGGTTDAFARGDYRTWSRLEDYGANPWHVILIVAGGGLLVAGVVRGDRSLRLPLLLAVGLTLGFTAFSATTRWSVYVTRYHLPLFVVWAPLIAIAVARVHRRVLVGVVGGLVVAVIPQLLDNSARSLLHRQPDAASDLDPYFYYREGTDAFVGPADFVAARDAIVDSGCDRLGIANWVLFEYPIWVGLDSAGWRGDIEHVDVSNASGALQDEDFEPCALIRQVLDQTPIVPPPGWIDMSFGDLAVAFAPGSMASEADPAG